MREASTRTSSGSAGGVPWPEKPRSWMSHCRTFSLSSIFWSSPFWKRASNSEARAWFKRRIAERCLFGV